MTHLDWIDLLFQHTWWRWAPGDRTWHSVTVHSFNLVEGVVWCVFSVLVFSRHLRFRRSYGEFLYGIAFLSFGVTDFIEANTLASWLIWLKVMNLLALWKLRAHSRTHWYPGNRMY